MEISENVSTWVGILSRWGLSVAANDPRPSAIFTLSSRHRSRDVPLERAMIPHSSRPFPLSEASNELYRTRLRKGRNQKFLPPVPSRHIIIPTTEASILISIHTTTNTPDALVESLTDTERGAVAEAHAPREGRIVHVSRC